MKSKEEITCDKLYSFTDIWYLFLSDNRTPSNDIQFEWEHFLPKKNYSCSLQVFYGGHTFLHINKTIETDFGSEYITYMHM